MNQCLFPEIMNSKYSSKKFSICKRSLIEQILNRRSRYHPILYKNKIAPNELYPKNVLHTIDHPNITKDFNTRKPSMTRKQLNLFFLKLKMDFPFEK